MKMLLQSLQAAPLSKAEQKNVYGGGPCNWKYECDYSGRWFNTLSECQARCTGGFCIRINPCL
jgi:hypothetical protein